MNINPDSLGKKNDWISINILKQKKKKYTEIKWSKSRIKNKLKLYVKKKIKNNPEIKDEKTLIFTLSSAIFRQKKTSSVETGKMNNEPQRRRKNSIW